METLDSNKRKYSDLDLEMMEEFGLDTKMMEDCGIDPKKTMDFAFFKVVCYEFLFPPGSHESMATFLKCNQSEDIERLPPLSVILYNDLLKTAWGWDRLLPWMSGYVLFEDYFWYLRRYFLKNASSVSELYTAATECVAAEEDLSRTIGGKPIPGDDCELSLKIKDKATHLMDSPTVPANVTVPAACLMCIMEEAKLMREVLTKFTGDDDKASDELLRKKFKFSNEVRKAAFDILTTYRGPYSEQVSASMLGMKKEAGIAFELLQRHDANHEEKIDVCEEIRGCTLELLKIIRERFPQDCVVKYCPIDLARRAMMGKRVTEHPVEPTKDIVSADEVSPVNINGIAIPNTPMTSKSAVPAAPSSWSEQDNMNNKKMKSMGLFQDTIMASTNSSDPKKYSGTEDKFGVPNPIAALETSIPSTSRESCPEENQKMENHDSDVVSLQTCDTSIETLDSDKREYSDLDLEMVEEFGLDLKMMEDCGLHPKKTMDFALFKGFCYEFLFPPGSHESMAMFLKCNQSEDFERLHPLSVILYDDLLKTAWGWDRLLPWMSGYVLFEDYFCYLGRYFPKNRSSVPELYTAATKCVDAEEDLSRTIGGKSIPGDDRELSLKIKDKATHLMDSPTVPANDTVPAACLMCITEEAKLMREVLTKFTGDDDKASDELLRKKFKFSNEVRKAAFDILTTYRGPYSEQVSASMLGMKKEAGIAFELLQRHDANHELKIDVCEEIRGCTLELLKIIHEHFPQDCEIKYCPIDLARDAMRLLVEPSKDIVSADAISPVISDGIDIPTTPITSKSAVPAGPSSWSEQEYTNNNKMKSMGLSQDSDTPSTQASELGNYSGTADKFRYFSPLTVLDTGAPSTRRVTPITIDPFDGESDLEDQPQIQGSEVASLQTQEADDEK